jgi:uncharacterized protein
MQGMNKRTLLVTLPVVLALVLVAATLPGAASSAAAESAGGITVQGTASVASIPDRAELSFGVESQGATARAALAANAAEMRKVIAAVKAAGGQNVKTQTVALSPRYNERNEVQSFVAVNTVSSTTTVARAGALIDAAVDAGANQVYGPSLTVSDRTDQYRQALRAAVANARASAQALAAAGNLSLGRITAIVESGVAPMPKAFGAADRAMVESTPIEAGSDETVATVTVTFAIS